VRSSASTRPIIKDVFAPSCLELFFLFFFFGDYVPDCGATVWSLGYMVPLSGRQWLVVVRNPSRPAACWNLVAA